MTISTNQRSGMRNRTKEEIIKKTSEDWVLSIDTFIEQAMKAQVVAACKAYILLRLYGENFACRNLWVDYGSTTKNYWMAGQKYFQFLVAVLSSKSFP